MKLLNIDANPKTVKGQKRGYMTAVMYLAPYTASGRNVCPFAELAGCWQGCLNTAGHGGISKGSVTMSTPAGDLPDNAIQRARIARTELYWSDREAFMVKLHGEIRKFIRKAERKGLTPVVRLNGTSDIQWERGHGLTVNAEYGMPQAYPSIMAAFPGVQFYDYTKIPGRLYRQLPPNYRLSLSYSEASTKYMDLCLKASREVNASLVCVVRDESVKARNMQAPSQRPLVDGDEHDLRFLDEPGAFVYLKAKGRARQDFSGFVLD